MTAVADLRRGALERLAAETLDVLIIGGGIVGAGIARDAAMRGLTTGLVEQHDFAFGTSSRSSRLLHGGLRYLAQGQIQMVREASREKRILHHIAPHLSGPLAFVFPGYRDNPHWKLWQLKVGVKVYDLLCGGRNLGQATWLSADEARARLPELETANLKGAVRYFDGFTNDARLVLDTLRSAANHGAILVNYGRFVNAENAAVDSRKPGWKCEVEDCISQRQQTIRARCVINATGPWAERVPHSRVKLRPTKGIHVVVERARIPVPDAVVMTEGRRILFAIPWGDRTILGTTDTDYSGPPDRVAADANDVAYVLGVVNRFFPGAQLTDGDIISTWAGLRPLVADAHGNPSDISRAHEISMAEPGWWDVTGGKLTTYRLMAEQTVDRIVRFLKSRNALVREAGACRTASELLLSREETESVSGLLPPEFSRQTVEHSCSREWAMHLDDVMVRRTGWHQYHKDAAARARHVAEWMGELMGWNPAQRAAEVQRYEELTACAGAAGNRSAAFTPLRGSIE